MKQSLLSFIYCINIFCAQAKFDRSDFLQLKKIYNQIIFNERINTFIEFKVINFELSITCYNRFFLMNKSLSHYQESRIYLENPIRLSFKPVLYIKNLTNAVVTRQGFAVSGIGKIYNNSSYKNCNRFQIYFLDNGQLDLSVNGTGLEFRS